MTVIFCNNDEIGSVELVMTMGTDSFIAESARMSTGAESKGPERDARLIEYLVKHNHTSPLEFGEMTFDVKCPIYVRGQWFRHRIGEFSEKSYRYTEAEAAPEPPYIYRLQAESNRQMSHSALSPADATKAAGLVFGAYKAAFSAYHDLLAMGVCREQARMVLPMATYTEFRWKANVHAIMHFCALRCSAHAQPEMQAFAHEVESQFKASFPITHGAYIKHYRGHYE